MIESSSKEIPFQPPLLSCSTNPTLPAPESPRIPDSIQKELAAMDVEFPEIIGDASTALTVGADLNANDSNIIHMNHRASPGPMHETTILETPPHCVQGHLDLILAARTLAQTIGRFFFNPNSETELSKPHKDFQVTQGFQLSPTTSKLE